LHDSNGIDNDEVIETLEIHYDIDYCDGCSVVLDDGYCYNDSCVDKQDECLEEEEDA